MKKLQTLTTSTAIALASVGGTAFAQEAQATPVPSNTSVNEPALVTKSQVKPLEKSEVPAPSTVKPALDAQKAVVKEAEAKIDTAKADVKEKEATVASTEKEVATATQAVKDAEATASQATPEKVAEVKDAQTKNLEAQTANQEATEATNEQIKAETKALAEKQSDVATAQENLDQATKNVKSAEQTVTNAESALDGTGLANAEKDLTDAQKAVKDAEDTVADAQTAFKNATKADADRDEAIKSAETDVKTKDDAVKLAKEKLTTADQHDKSVDAKLQTAQDELKKAENALKNVDTVDIADLTQFKKDKAEGDSDFMTDSGATVIENSSTKISEADKKRIVNFNNITEEQKQELALYNLKVVNAIRKNLGLPELELNTGSMKAAQNQMDKYIARNKSILTNGHLPGDYFGENGGPIAFAKHGTSLTMYKVKQEIYNVVMSQAFADAPSKWGHSSNIQKAISHLGASFGIIDGELYSINVFGVYTGSTIKDENDTASLEKAVETAKSNLEQATTASENAKKALTKASTDYASALSLKTEAEKVLADAMATPLQAQVAENNLRLAEIALENAKAREAKANDAASNFSASLADKKKALEKAQTELEGAKGVQTTASQALENATAELRAQEDKVNSLKEQSTKLLADKDALVKEAKKLAEQLQAYLDAPTKLATAKDEQAKAEDKLAQVKAELTTAQSTLENLLSAYHTEHAKLVDLQTKYDELVDLAEKAQDNVVATLPDGTVIAVPKVAPTAEALPELNPEALAKEDAKDGNVKTLPDGKIVAVPKDAPVTEKLPTVNVDELKKALDAGKKVTLDAQGNVVVKEQHETYSAPAVKAVENEKVTYSRVERAKTLPNTGTKESNITLFVLAILSGFGLVSIKRQGK